MTWQTRKELRQESVDYHRSAVLWKARYTDAINTVSKLREKLEKHSIQLKPAEIQSGLSRVRWAEGLIRQLPGDHDGRNSWLLNYAEITEDRDPDPFAYVED